jgi:hypothetical protein
VPLPVGILANQAPSVQGQLCARGFPLDGRLDKIGRGEHCPARKHEADVNYCITDPPSCEHNVTICETPVRKGAFPDSQLVEREHKAAVSLDGMSPRPDSTGGSLCAASFASSVVSPSGSFRLRHECEQQDGSSGLNTQRSMSSTETGKLLQNSGTRSPMQAEQLAFVHMRMPEVIGRPAAAVASEGTDENEQMLREDVTTDKRAFAAARVGAAVQEERWQHDEITNSNTCVASSEVSDSDEDMELKRPAWRLHEWAEVLLLRGDGVEKEAAMSPAAHQRVESSLEISPSQMFTTPDGTNKSEPSSSTPVAAEEEISCATKIGMLRKLVQQAQAQLQQAQERRARDAQSFARVRLEERGIGVLTPLTSSSSDSEFILGASFSSPCSEEVLALGTAAHVSGLIEVPTPLRLLHAHCAAQQ